MDVAWTELWLPIVLCAVALQFVSTMLWAVLPWHKPDVLPLPDQKAFDDAVGPLDIPAGFYLSPCTHDAQEMKSEAFQKRYAKGPWMSLNVYPGKPSMGKNIPLTFVFFLVVSSIVAYLASAAVPAGAEYMHVFRIAGAAALLGYVFGGIPNDIWFAKPTRWCVTGMIDAIIYAVLSAGFFAGLWPEGPAAGAVPVPVP